MAILMDEYIDLAGFVHNLMRSPGTDYFRGLRVRCEHRFGGHAWTVYGPKTDAFATDIGWDEADYVAGRLIRNGALNVEAPNGLTA